MPLHFDVYAVYEHRNRYGPIGICVNWLMNNNAKDVWGGSQNMTYFVHQRAKCPAQNICWSQFRYPLQKLHSVKKTICQYMVLTNICLKNPVSVGLEFVTKAVFVILTALLNFYILYFLAWIYTWILIFISHSSHL